MAALYIVIEGMDGSGKTTQSGLLIEFLKKNSFKVYHNIEPSSSVVGKLIQKMITSKSYRPETISLAFALDRMVAYDENLKFAKKNTITLYPIVLIFPPLHISPFRAVVMIGSKI